MRSGWKIASFYPSSGQQDYCSKNNHLVVKDHLFKHPTRKSESTNFEFQELCEYPWKA